MTGPVRIGGLDVPRWMLWVVLIAASLSLALDATVIAWCVSHWSP